MFATTVICGVFLLILNRLVTARLTTPTLALCETSKSSSGIRLCILQTTRKMHRHSQNVSSGEELPKIHQCSDENSKTVASQLRNLQLLDSVDQIQVKVVFDEDLIEAFSDLLISRHKIWSHVHFCFCSGQVQLAMFRTLSTDHVKRISFEDQLTPDIMDYPAFWEALETAASLEDLRVTCNIHEADGIAIGKSLASSTSLQTLDCSTCIFREQSYSYIFRGLHENKHITTLAINHCNLWDEQLSALISSLLDHPVLCCLRLSSNQWGERTLAQLAKLLAKEQGTLRELDLSGQLPITVDKANIQEFVNALSRNTALESLFLENCKLDDSDAERLAQALVQNRTLKELNICDNKISDVGIRTFSQRLPHMYGLEKLFLMGNPFGEEGAAAMLMAMETNVVLLEYFDDSVCCQSNQMEYYTDLNRGGRKLLKGQMNQIPLSLWPFVLERIDKIHLPPRDQSSVDKLDFNSGCIENQRRLSILYCVVKESALFDRRSSYDTPFTMSC